MAEVTITLLLSREQRLQFFAHLITYLFCRTLPSFVAPPGIALDTVQLLGSRLLHLCMDERETVIFSLDPAEGRAVNELLATLETQYAQWPQREESAMALQHLAACRHLLQQAGRQIINERRGE